MADNTEHVLVSLWKWRQQLIVLPNKGIYKKQSNKQTVLMQQDRHERAAFSHALCRVAATCGFTPKLLSL